MGKANRNRRQRVTAPPGAPSSSGGRPSWLLPVAGAAVVAVVAAIVLVLALSGGGSGTKSVEAAMKSAGCTLRAVKPIPPQKDKKNYHADVASLTAKVKWSTNPPSAGAHWGAWAVWNFYFDAVNPRMLVHNEEHGGVIIWWGNKVPGTEIDKLNSFYNESPEGMVGTPYKELGDKIALTAWTGNPSHYYQDGDYGTGHIAICKRFNEKAFTAFRDAYRGNGPEGIPLSADAPGTGPQG
jgi:hypothetical protein